MRTVFPGKSVMLPTFQTLLIPQPWISCCLFYEKAATFAMIQHGMDVVHQILQLKTSSCYCYWPTSFCPSKVCPVVFHCDPWREVCCHVWTSYWNGSVAYHWWLEGSGWTTILSDAGIAFQGTVDSFQKAPLKKMPQQPNHCTSFVKTTERCLEGEGQSQIQYIKNEKMTWSRRVLPYSSGISLLNLRVLLSYFVILTETLTSL